MDEEDTTEESTPANVQQTKSQDKSETVTPVIDSK